MVGYGNGILMYLISLLPDYHKYHTIKCHNGLLEILLHGLDQICV